MKFSHHDLLKVKTYSGHAISFAQHKADGYRVLIDTFTSKPRVTTREGKTNFWPKIRCHKNIHRLVTGMPGNTAVDAELHSPFDQATDIRTLALKGDERLKLTPFARPVLKGEDTRGEHIADVLAWFETRNWRPTTTLHFAPRHLPRPLEPAEIEDLMEQAQRARFEGWVAKKDHYEGWYKLKPTRTLDAVVTGYTISDSDSFTGGLKAVQVSVFRPGGEPQEVASVASGFSIEYRMSVNPRTLLGRVCEVEYDSVAGRGKLKFPRFLRWRDDKPAEECTAYQLET